MINAALYNTELVKPAVSVYPTGGGQKFRVTWAPQPGSLGFRVYAGFDPIHIRSLVSGDAALPNTATEFEVVVPPVPPMQIIYFWVASVESSKIRFLDELGSYVFRTVQYDQFNNDSLASDDTIGLFCPGASDSQYFMEEIRRRAKVVLADTGEEADLYIRQWRGLPEPSVQSELGLDPNFQGMTRTPGSYGTGYYPGYFPAIRIRVRFGGLPSAQYDFQVPGMRPLAPNEQWSLWEPVIHEGDVLIRVNTGVRYVVKQNAYSNYRGIPIIQRFSTDTISPTNPIYKIVDEELWEKWRNISAADYSRIGFSAMPVTDPNLKDYLIFK